MKTLALLMNMMLLTINCADNPVDGKPENREPVIFSLVAFPEIIKPNDSLIVICNAYDPDGDTLVYDWYTDGTIRIKGAREYEHALFNTHANSQIFYAPDSQFVSAPQDTFWVGCAARDGKGGQDYRTIYFIVKQDIGGD